MNRRESRVLTEGCQYFEISLTDLQRDQFMDYYELLVEWNKVMNLTAITDFDEVMQKHFVDSLALTRAVDLKSVGNLLDIGTGAGFPGIPLKIVFPHLEVVLLDSLNKRIRFLNEVIERLGLTGIRAIHGRAEDYAKKEEYREGFDLCVSRAVANLSTLSEYCIPYTKVKGRFISYKSGEAEEEIRAAKSAVSILSGKCVDTVKFTLPNSDIERSLVVIEKIKHTSGKYPRKAGLPAKEPLK